jgi:hypothetical protein
MLTVRWKEESYIEDNECCPIRKQNANEKMRIQGKFKPAGSEQEKDMPFFPSSGQDFANIWPYGTPQPKKDFLGYPDGPPKMDGWYPRSDLAGKYTYSLYVRGELCDTKSYNVE